jgi:hypothetical protein
VSEPDVGPGPYWWCLHHESVEGQDGCPNTERMGPYETAAAAARALQTARERTQAWDTDPNWND